MLKNKEIDTDEFDIVDVLKSTSGWSPLSLSFEIVLGIENMLRFEIRIS